jgi:WD40 repeat protein
MPSPIKLRAGAGHRLLALMLGAGIISALAIGQAGRSSTAAPAQAEQKRQVRLLPIQSTVNLLDLQQSPDGRRLLAHDRVSAPKLWDADRMLLLAELVPPRGLKGDSVGSAQMSPDGKLIATASPGRIVIWDAASARIAGVAVEEEKYFTSLVWSRNSQWLLICTREGKVGVLSPKDPTKITWLGSHTMLIRQADISMDGSLVAMASGDGSASLWKTSGELVKVLGSWQGPQSSLGGLDKVDAKSIYFSADDSQILVSVSDGKARLFDAKTGAILLEKEHVAGSRNILGNPQIGARFAGPKGEWMIVAGRDGTMEVIDRKNLAPVRKLTGHTKALRELRISLDGLKAGTYGDDDKLKLWDISTGKELPFARPEDDGPMAGEFSFDSKSFWVGYQSGTIRRHDLATGVAQQIQAGAALVINSAVFFPESGRMRLSASPDTRSFTYRPIFASMEQSAPTFSPPATTFGHVSSPDGRMLVLQDTATNTLRVHDLDRPSLTKPERSWSYRQAFFSKDNSKLFLVQSKGVFKIRTDTMEIEDSWGFEEAQVWRDAIPSPDGTKVILTNYVIPGSQPQVIVLDLVKDLFTRFAPFRSGYTVPAWTPESTKIILSEHEKTDVYSGEDYTLVKTIEHKNFTPVRHEVTVVDSRHAVLTGLAGLVLDIEEGKVVRDLGPMMDAPTTGAAISADKRLIVFGRSGNQLAPPEGNSLRVEELISGKEVAVRYDSAIIGCGFIHGTNRIWLEHFNDIDILSLNESAKTLKREGTFAAMRDGSWLALDDEGRYDATDPGRVPGASYVISWPGGIEAIEVEQMKGRYYDPNLFAKILGIDKDPKREVPPLASLRLFPEVKVSQNSRKTNLIDIELKPRDDGGIGKVVVKVNGKVVDTREGKGYYSIDRASFSSLLLPEAALPPGSTNWLEVIATNQDGDLTSPPTRLDLGVPQDLKAPDVKLYALFTGVGDYIGTDGDLQAPPKDARELAKSLLVTADRLLPGRVEVEVLTTGDPAKKPTRAAILAWLKDVSTKATSSDILLVYLSGHGTSKMGDKTGYFFLAADADPANLAASAIGTTVVSGEDLQAALAAIPAQKQVVILDTCHSGAAAKDLVADRSVSGDYRRAYESLRDAAGVWLLAGSAADQLSYESVQVDHGMLTYSLLEAIDQASPAGLRPGNGSELFLDVERWLTYAADRVESLKNEVGIKGVQRPEFRRSSASSFDLGLTKPEFRGQLSLRPPKPVVIVGTFDLDEEDPLGLEKVIATEMRQAEGVKAWFDIAKHPMVYRIAGSYTVSGEVVKVRIVVQRFDAEMNRRTLETIEVEGAKSNLAALALKLRQAVETKILVLEVPIKTPGNLGGPAAQPAGAG